MTGDDRDNQIIQSLFRKTGQTSKELSAEISQAHTRMKALRDKGLVFCVPAPVDGQKASTRAEYSLTQKGTERAKKFNGQYFPKTVAKPSETVVSPKVDRKHGNIVLAQGYEENTLWAKTRGKVIDKTDTAWCILDGNGTDNWYPKSCVRFIPGCNNEVWITVLKLIQKEMISEEEKALLFDDAFPEEEVPQEGAHEDEDDDDNPPPPVRRSIRRLK
jgi:hypothetical protein